MIERLSAWGLPKVLLLLLVIFSVFRMTLAAQTNQVRRVLVFNEIGFGSPGIAVMDQEIVAALEKLPYHVEFYSENLDTSLFPDEASQAQFREWYFHKYRERKLDLIIALGPSPIKFMVDSHKVFAPGTPIIFWGATEDGAELPELDTDFTGVWGVAQPEKTLDAALHLLPGTEHVVVVGGVAPYDRHLEGLVKERFRSFESKVDFTYLTDLDMHTLLDRLKRLPSNTIVYHTSIMRDAAGTDFIDATQSAPMVASAANAPVFVVDDVDVGQGTVGGNVFSFATAGRVIANMAVRILNGERPTNIQVVRGANVYLFDWRELRRWNLRESDLPPGSVVLNKELTFWEAYRQYVISGIFLLLVQASIILGLLWHRAKRMKTIVELAHSNARLRLATESGKSTGWEWDLGSGREVWFGDLRNVFGIPSDTFTGKVGGIFRYVHPEDQERVSQAIERAKLSHGGYSEECRIVRSDGSTRWVLSRGIFEYGANDRATRMFGLASDITDLKQAEEDRLRHAAIVESSDDAIISKSLEGVILSWNGGARRIFGYTEAESIGRPITMIVPPELLDEEGEILARLRAGEGIEHFETLRVAKDGRRIYVSLTISPIRDLVGRIVGICKIARDITERKRAEATLRESEARFRLVANRAPVMIWMSGVDKLCTYFNQFWLEFTGRSLEQGMENGWAEAIHPNDLPRCLDTYTTSFDHREPFQMEYRLRRHDGAYRWIFDTGVPRLNADGSFAGYIGSCMDVTDRKLAEEALSTVGRKLIEAHEEERTRIARELHDDINQRIALLAVTLGGLKQGPRTSAVELRQGVDKTIKQLGELGSDVQSLSHRLHSSKLELLGLAPAAASFCREISDRQGAKVDFHSEGVPKELPQEVSLCLFRVLQEALQNSIKHSGSRHFEVSLTGGLNELHLTVSDSGIGFDPGEAMKGRGLGLTSMKERLKLLNGDLSIDSQLQRGTTVFARVPLNTKMKSAAAAG